MNDYHSQQRASRGARSLPHKRPYLSAMVFSVVQLLAGTAFLTITVILVLHPASTGLMAPLLLLALALASWGLAYGVRRLARCPLCKGTPLIDSAAAKHVRARRIGPLNHGFTAVLSLLLQLRFRCMYCGSTFDLLKPSPSDSQPADRY